MSINENQLMKNQLKNQLMKNQLMKNQLMKINLSLKLVEKLTVLPSIIYKGFIFFILLYIIYKGLFSISFSLFISLAFCSGILS